jgi:DNA polymerase-4
MLMTREKMIDMHSRIDHDKMDVVVANLAATSEFLKATAKMVESAYQRVLVSASAARTLKVKFTGFELISRSRTLACEVGSRSELESVSVALLKMLFPMEKAVRLLGVSISGFSVGETAHAEQIALAL